MNRVQIHESEYSAFREQAKLMIGRLLESREQHLLAGGDPTPCSVGATYTMPDGRELILQLKFGDGSDGIARIELVQIKMER